jgi:hypothetical protein
MKTKIILGLATIAALALPAMADDGNRYRDHDGDRRGYVSQDYRDGRYDGGYYRTYDGNAYVGAPVYYGYDNHEAREMRERRERLERERNHEYREHHEGFYR